MRDKSYSLPTMQRKLASDSPSQVDAATAYIAVDSNALGRAILLWQAAEAAGTYSLSLSVSLSLCLSLSDSLTLSDRSPSGEGNAPRAARFFRPSQNHSAKL